jgi:GH15 family glucan-1,4-alpha-glucosidase
MKKLILVLILASVHGFAQKNIELYQKIKSDQTLKSVKEKALEVVKTGFNAGDGYGEVWIRDYNTFLTLSAAVHPHETLKENLRVFFRLQGQDGNIVDGFIPIEKARASKVGYEYIFTDLEKHYAGHKNTVETDQESSLLQAVYRYIKVTGDKAFLKEKIGGITVEDRMAKAVDFLLKHRWNEQYGLIWGATTADWGDVQPEHDWGVYLTKDTHLAIDIYDNAMLVIALDNFMNLVPQQKAKWLPVRKKLAVNAMKHLWDTKNNKFIPHIYLNGSPFPASLDENKIYYHGGTAVAIEAGLLNKQQIRVSLDKMIDNVKQSGAATIGLTLYPTYPAGSFKNKGMYPYGYQNGGDWTWFGGRMIQQLIRYDFDQEAYEQLQPMLKRVIDNKGFFEWYTVDNQPKGSGTFRGEAGVLYEVILALEKKIK